MKRFSILLLVTAAFALGGCGLAQQARLKKAQEETAAATAACRTRYTSYADRADCQTAAEDQLYRPTVRYGDLLTVLQAQRKVFAVAIDNGQMTKDQANLQLAQVMSGLAQEEQRRNNEAGAVAAQQSAASAQMLGAAAAMLQSSRPAPVVVAPMQPVVNTTCYPMGAYVNCTSR